MKQKNHQIIILALLAFALITAATGCSSKGEYLILDHEYIRIPNGDAFAYAVIKLPDGRILEVEKINQSESGCYFLCGDYCSLADLKGFGADVESIIAKKSNAMERLERLCPKENWPFYKVVEKVEYSDNSALKVVFKKITLEHSQKATPVGTYEIPVVKEGDDELELVTKDTDLYMQFVVDKAYPSNHPFMQGNTDDLRPRTVEGEEFFVIVNKILVVDGNTFVYFKMAKSSAEPKDENKTEGWTTSGDLLKLKIPGKSLSFNDKKVYSTAKEPLQSLRHGLAKMQPIVEKPDEEQKK